MNKGKKIMTRRNNTFTRLVTSFIIMVFSFTIAQDDFNNETEEVITISGKITDASSGRIIAGANIVVDGTEMGAASDEEGMYIIEGVEIGSSITASVIGYENNTLYADSENLDFALTVSIIEMSSLEVLASRAGDDTPVAYTNITKEELNLRLASRDIPLALNTVPSVYATGQGGGSGDARINVRGFNQRNVAIMLNGIPVNDMENGWVYWSNWDGLADATSSIQMQKGLSAQNLATPSIGGSMNIITDPSAQERRGLFKQEIGAWGFLKSTLSYHSGLLMDDKLALSGTVVRKTGDGYVQGTWTDAWAYYFDVSYTLSDAHRFQFYALGAPQRHGQNLYKQNAAVYDQQWALDNLEGYQEEALAENGGEFMEAGRDFNQNVSKISDASQAILDAAGGQHYVMYSEYDGVDRHQSDELAERENFFHKPQVALNHYWSINDDMRLSSSLYWSGGMGGGTGTYGTITTKDANGVSDAGTAESNNYKFYYGPSPWVRDWDALIAINSAPAGMAYAYKRTFDRGNKESIGILRNSNNRQSTIGVLSKLNYDVNDNLKAQVGLDWRTAQIYHVKTIRDLLGGEYFVNTDSDFDAEGQQKGLGDPIDYNFTNTVDWLGLFGQAQYTSGALTGYGMAGITTVKYTHWNHFLRAADYDFDYVSEKDGSSADWVEGPGDAGGNAGELFIEADPISTMQIKGGVSYGIGDALSFLNMIPVFGKIYDDASVWFNFGLIDKAPIFDQVIQDWDAKMSSDPKNEKFQAFEFGLNTRSNDGTMAGKLNLYSTTWTDRIMTRQVYDPEAEDETIVYLSGINQQHNGVEVELSAQVNSMIRVDLGVGMGSWKFTDDASGTYRDGDTDQEYIYGLKDLMVGDSPQANMSLGLNIIPIEGAVIQTNYRFYAMHYSNWEPTSREGGQDRTQVWRTPSYGVLDIHGAYDLPLEIGSAKPQLFFHIINALDAIYIQDATDNSPYNSWDKTHTADDAEVYFGLPMSFNVGLSVNF